MSERRWLPLAVLGVGVTAVAWAAILVREADAPALVIAAYRLSFAAVPVGALAALQQYRRPEPVSTRSIGPLLLSGVFLAAHFAFWITAIQKTSVVTAVVLMSTQPLFVGIAAPLVLGERVDRRIWVALMVALAGTALMASEDLREGLGTFAGDIYAVLGGAFAAAYIMVGRWARPATSWARYVGIVYPVTAVLLVAIVLIADEPFTGYSTKTWIMIALLALGPQLVGHSSINFALAYLPAVTVAIGILVEPVGSTALAALILDETPSALEMIGGGIVLAGVIFAIRPEARVIEEAPAALDIETG
ncbi:MAG: DMT family transporter [Dehalococcoidia bacterium]